MAKMRNTCLRSKQMVILKLSHTERFANANIEKINNCIANSMFILKDIDEYERQIKIFILVLSKANLVNKAKSEGSNFKDENLVTAISRVKRIEFL